MAIWRIQCLIVLLTVLLVLSAVNVNSIDNVPGGWSRPCVHVRADDEPGGGCDYKTITITRSNLHNYDSTIDYDCSQKFKNYDNLPHSWPWGCPNNYSDGVSEGCWFYAVEVDEPEGNKNDCLIAFVKPGAKLAGKNAGKSYFTLDILDNQIYSWWAVADQGSLWYGDILGDSYGGPWDYEDSFCALTSTITQDAWQGWHYKSQQPYICMANEWVPCNQNTLGKWFLLEPGNWNSMDPQMHESPIAKCTSEGWKFQTDNGLKDVAMDYPGVFTALDSDADGFYVFHSPYDDLTDIPDSDVVTAGDEEYEKFEEVYAVRVGDFVVPRIYDCDDGDAGVPITDDMGRRIKESTEELCNNEIDDDCNGFTDADDPSCYLHVDKDGDGVTPAEGDCSDFYMFSLDSEESVSSICPDNPNDCNFNSSFCSICIHPGGGEYNLIPAVEYCDGIDNDCDGYIDDFCEGDFSKEQCNEIGAKWFNVGNSGTCCGDDIYIFDMEEGHWERLSGIGNISNENEFSDRLSGETFIAPDNEHACFEGSAYSVNNQERGVLPFEKSIIPLCNLSDFNGYFESQRIPLSREDLNRKFEIHVRVRSDTPLSFEFIADSILDDKVKKISNLIDFLYLTPHEDTATDFLLDQNTISSFTIPSTNGERRRYAITDITIPTTEELENSASEFNNLKSDEVYSIQLRITPEILDEWAEYESEVLVYLKPLVRNKVLWSPSDEEFYGCYGVLENGNLGDNTEYTYFLGPTGSVDRSIRGTLMTGLENDKIKPDYEGEGTLPHAITDSNVVGFCGNKSGWVCQVDGGWQLPKSGGPGTNYKSLPEGMMEDEDFNMIEVTGMFVPEPIEEGMQLMEVLPPRKRYSRGCCAEDACWNGYECVASVGILHGDEEPQLEYKDDSWMCVNGEWQEVEKKKDQYYFLNGTCPTNMCFLNAGSPQFFTPFSTDPNNICYHSGKSWYDYTCIDGEWKTRTLLLATHMVSILPDGLDSDDYTLNCNSYSSALNDVYYNAVVPPHYELGQQGPEALSEGAELVSDDTSTYLTEPTEDIESSLEDVYPAINADIAGFFNLGSFDEWPLVNNFCTLTYNDDGEDKVVIGVSTNNPIWSVGEQNLPPGLLEIVNNSQSSSDPPYYDYCEGAILKSNNTEDGYFGCAGSSHIDYGDPARVWYNHDRKSLIYSPDKIALDVIDWETGSDEIRNVFTEPTKDAAANLDLGLSSEMQAYLEKSIEKGSNANHIYIARAGGKEIVAVTEPIEIAFGRGIMTVIYKGFDYNLCEDEEWWDNFKTVAKELGSTACDEGRCSCKYDDDTTIISVYGSFYREDIDGSLRLMPDMTSKLRPESGEQGFFHTIINWIINLFT